jgi:Ala-tRNA(Pro) deacylase
MAIAHKVQDYLNKYGISYDLVTHPHSQSSMETAQVAHVPGSRLAKSVVLEDDNGYVMAVLPSTCHVRLGSLSKELNRELRLATEKELSALFGDCEIGAVPPVGLAYGMRTVIDESLAEEPEVFFEAGDHEHLIHMRRDAFAELAARSERARFAGQM